jgi:hypothetical protein
MCLFFPIAEMDDGIQPSVLLALAESRGWAKQGFSPSEYRGATEKPCFARTRWLKPNPENPENPENRMHPEFAEQLLCNAIKQKKARLVPGFGWSR